MITKQDIENRIHRLGHEINSTIEGEIPSFFDQERWKGKLLEWAMKDQVFRTQLLRFIDVLPALKSDSLIVKILKEYFTKDSNTPTFIEWGIKRLSKRGLIPMISARVIRANVQRLARQFIAGNDHQDALLPLESLRKDCLAFTVDLIGEMVLSEREAQDYQRRYLKLLDFLHDKVNRWDENPILDQDSNGEIPRLNVSLKVSSFYSQLNPMAWERSIEGAKEGLRPVLRKVMELNASVTFDMEHYHIKDLTIAIFKSIVSEDEFKDLNHVGIALQAYLKDSRDDLMDIIHWAESNQRRISIRLVKGAYWDYETVINRQKGWPIPVFLNKHETDSNFEALSHILLENTGWINPCIASHNLRSLCHSLSVAEAMNLSKNTLEIQLIYGMAEPIRHALKDMGYRVRIYTPVGELLPGMAYFVRRILENTSNESILRKSYSEGLSLDELLSSPQSQSQEPATNHIASTNNSYNNQPLLDFSVEDNRENMMKALKRVKKQLGQKYPLFINHHKVWTEEHTHSINPSNPDEVVGQVSLATKENAEKAIEEAKEAWQSWRRIPAQDRAAILFKGADLMRKNYFDLAALEVYEVGKTWAEADGDIAEAIDHLDFYAQEMIRLNEAHPLGNYPGEDNRYIYEPKGLGLVISPWNFPLAIPVGMVAASLVTGNCVILKPSSLSPVIAYKLYEILMEAGLPKGVFQFLPCRGDHLGDYLVSHPDIDFIAFTGSRDVGLNIIKLAGQTSPTQRSVKRVIAEMGGKNAIIVDGTADLDEAVKGVLESALGFQGQKCSACSRVILVGDVIHDFTDRLKEAMESVKIGSPEDPDNFMGPVVDGKALKKIEHYISLGKQEGKVILAGKASDKGYFIGPSLFTDIQPDSILAQEEIFGPVLALIHSETIDQAIDIANNTIYALTGGIYSRSPGNIEKVRANLNVGNLYINRKITGALVSRQPFGGFAMSGIGSKAGGPDYLVQFMNPKTISENTLRRGFAPPTHR